MKVPHAGAFIFCIPAADAKSVPDARGRPFMEKRGRVIFCNARGNEQTDRAQNADSGGAAPLFQCGYPQARRPAVLRAAARDAGRHRRHLHGQLCGRRGGFRRFARQHVQYDLYLSVYGAGVGRRRRGQPVHRPPGARAGRPFRQPAPDVLHAALRGAHGGFADLEPPAARPAVRQRGGRRHGGVRRLSAHFGVLLPGARGLQCGRSALPQHERDESARFRPLRSPCSAFGGAARSGTTCATFSAGKAACSGAS